MGCENTHLPDTAEYRNQVCSDKHCNGSPAERNEFAAFWKLLCNITGVPEMETLCVSEAFRNHSMLGQLLLKWT
jgi:hypothetical protein